MTNLGRFLDDADPERTALVVGARRYTYGALARRSDELGAGLLAAGVRPGDRVLTAMSDGVDFVVTWFAAQKIGAVTVELYSFLPPKDYRELVDYVEPAAVIVDASTIDAVREAGVTDLLVAGELGTALLPGEQHLDALATAGSGPVTVDRDLDEVALLKFTTGSTGRPKAALLPLRSPLLSFAGVARAVLDLRPDDVVLPVPKMFFGYARDLAALFPFGAGATSILFPERSTPDRIFDLVDEHRPTILVNVPTMMEAMVSHPRAGGADLSSLRLCTSAGEALPVELRRRWDETFGVEVLDMIGSAEAYHGFLSERVGSHRPGSLGHPVPGYRVRVVGDDGAEVPHGATGRLEIRGDAVAFGYWKEPEKSAATFPRPRTTLSGDLFRRDGDGFYYFEGRADDLIKVSGIWVSPLEVEECLLTHPDVATAVVHGKERQGLVHARALVVLAPGAAAADAGDLQRYVRGRLAPHKVPHAIRFVTTLPHTANGKIDRRAARDLA